MNTTQSITMRNLTRSNSTGTLQNLRSARMEFFSPWDTILYGEWSRFQFIHDRWTSIFDKIETALLIAGFLGNVLALITLLRGRHMRTPSFIYHKALVTAYAIYCLNFLIVKYVNYSLTVPGERRLLSYYDKTTAYYAMILNRVITSVCGYLALYTSLAISIDRFWALVVYKTYGRFNRRVVAYAWIAASLVLSVLVHSWAPWMENQIYPEATTTITPTSDNKTRNRTTVTYSQRDSSIIERLKPYLVAKDWYNLSVRFTYAILLTIFTCVVIYTFFQQQKRKVSLCNVPKKRIRRERSLFYLMVAVVIMAYIQVIPRESKRILELIYPYEYVARKIADPGLSFGTRRAYLLFGLYGYTFSTPVLNLCTAIERSLLFYVYFSLNHTFRREVLTLLKVRQLWRAVMVKLGSIRKADIGLDRCGGGDGTSFETSQTETGRYGKLSTTGHAHLSAGLGAVGGMVGQWRRIAMGRRKQRDDSSIARLELGTALLGGCGLGVNVDRIKFVSNSDRQESMTSFNEHL